MHTSLKIQLISSVLLLAMGLVLANGIGYFLAGMATAGLLFSTVGWWVVRAQQRRFNKWLSDAVSTEVMEPEAEEESVKP